LPAVGNEEIAKVFFEVADILEMQDVQWKPKAYRAAAFAIESMPEPVGAIFAKGGIKALEEIPGVGVAIAKKLEEIIKTGKLRHLEELRKSMPMDVEALNAIPGLGPKKLVVLHRQLGIKSLADLKKAAEQHRIAGLPGFGEKSEQDILKAVQMDGKKSDRVPISAAKPVAEEIVKLLQNVPGTKMAEVAGSFRRKRETVGDLDILVSSTRPNAATKAFISMPSVKKVLATGPTKSSVVLRNGLQSDLRVVKPRQWGSALQYFTGSKAHSIELRKIAQKKGLKLSEYGVFRGKKVVASRTEKDVYNALGMDYIKPESRENEGEIEAAINGFRAKKK